MKRVLDRIWLPLALVAASLWIALENTTTGDYFGDAAGAVQALGRGDIGAYLSAKPIMGPFATLIQAPFALLGSDELTEFNWASVPCLLVAAAVGVYLGRMARRRGAPRITEVTIAGLTLINPITFYAVGSGHPEEVLTAALAVGAVAVASDGRSVLAGVLLGLAVASKQWAVVAIFPVVMALPRDRVRALIAAAIPLAVLTLPGLIAAPGSFMHVQENAGSGGDTSGIWSLWYPLTSVETVTLSHGLSNEVHRMPSLFVPVTHPLIVLLVFAVPLALWRWRGQFRLDPEQAMALLALLALLRCVLDPVNNFYYHEPLLLALIGWDAVSSDRWPVRTVLGVGIAWVFERWSRDLGDLEIFNAVYLVVIAGAAVAILAPLLRRGSRAPRRDGLLARLGAQPN